MKKPVNLREQRERLALRFDFSLFWLLMMLIWIWGGHNSIMQAFGIMGTAGALSLMGNALFGLWRCMRAKTQHQVTGS